MKTLNVYNALHLSTDKFKATLGICRWFVIGVKGNLNYSLENLQATFPTLKIERFKEVVNPRYLVTDEDGNLDDENSLGHMLQPAFVYFDPKDL